MIINKARRVQAVTGILVGCFLVALSTAYFLWRDAFTVVLALGGLTGALIILYEVRLTKRIAQAEFIRDLNDAFTSNTNISELWRMLLLSQPIGMAERHLVSTYPTFFETLQLLLTRGVIDFGLIDNLFRNRFFTAIGDEGIQSTALMTQNGSFNNIHVLAQSWREHLRAAGLRMPDGYYSYLRAISAAMDCQIESLGSADLGELLELQDEVASSLGDGDWLRKNSPEMFAECLEAHVVLGARRNGVLVAAAILFDGGDGPENLRRYLPHDEERLKEACNLKLVLVSPSARRSGLAATLVELLEQQALTRGKSEILCTVHPRNKPSGRLFAELGYVRMARVRTAYGSRNVLGRNLPKSVLVTRTRIGR